MNFNPELFKYQVVPAQARGGVEVHLTRTETGAAKVFYLANQAVDSVGLHEHMLSLTDELMIDFFEQRKKPKKEKGKR